MTQVDRNTDYDFLRFVGIACIILAHVGVGGIVFQIRNFDVPLMVLLSGISYANFSSQNYPSYTKYLKSRFARLVIPAWIFLVFYDMTLFLYSHQLPCARDIAMQITLTGGTDIGIWIIRIFFTMAIIAPFIFRLNSNIKKNITFYVLAVCSWLVYEISVQQAKEFLPHKAYVLLQLIIFFTYSYGLILMLGMRLPSMSPYMIKKEIVIFGTIFAVFILFNLFKHSLLLPTQQFKYPPLLYYVSYAISASLLIFYLTTYTNTFNLVKKNRLVLFIGKSTMWIYLWHWLCLKLYNILNFDFFIFGKYIFVFSLATTIAYLQFKFIIFLQNSIYFKRFSYIRKIFIG